MNVLKNNLRDSKNVGRMFADVLRSKPYRNMLTHLDHAKSFLMSIYLQKSGSIQPRTSLSKFGGKFSSLFIRLLRGDGRERRREVGHGGRELGCRTLCPGDREEH